MRLWTQCILSELWSIQRTEENLSNNIGKLHQKPESCKWTAHCRERHHPVPVKVAYQLFHHEFRVLEKTEADCLLGLDFLERHKREPLFSRSELKLYSPHSIPLLSFESLRPKPLKCQQATQQFFQHTSQIGRNYLPTYMLFSNLWEMSLLVETFRLPTYLLIFPTRRSLSFWLTQRILRSQYTKTQLMGHQNFYRMTSSTMLAAHW